MDDRKQEIILQPYSVTVSQHSLTALEMRIIALVLLKLKNVQLEGWTDEVREGQDLFGNYHIVKINNADMVAGENYTQIRAALNRLRKRDITLRTHLSNGKSGELYTSIVRSAKYSDDRTTIELDLEPELMQELIYLGKNYTKHGLEFLYQTSSAHAIRWYQIGCHWLNRTIFYMSKEDIRTIFRLKPDSYPRTQSFFDRVIKRPLDEVNAKSDINIQVEKIHKNGKKIIGYTFKVQRLKQIQPVLVIDDLHSFIEQYLDENSHKIEYFCYKGNVAKDYIRNIIIDRGVVGDIKGYKHYKSLTDRYITAIFSKYVSLDKEELRRNWDNM